MAQPTPPEMPKARRVLDACRVMGLSRSTLYALAKKGNLRFVKVAGRTLVPESEIDRLLKIEERV
jgi:excisionase family DNA binding protein